jgi:hypothetical protein
MVETAVHHLFQRVLPECNAQDWSLRVPRMPQFVADPALTDVTLLWAHDLFEDEIHFNQDSSQQGILLKQRMHVVAVFVRPKCRLLILRQRNRAVGVFVSLKGRFRGMALLSVRQIFYCHD